MARIFTESFEGDHILQWTTGNDYRLTTPGLDGSTYAGQCIGGGRYGDFVVPATAEFYIGMYSNDSTVLTNSFPIQWMGSGGVLGYIFIDNTTKALKAFDGTNTYTSTKIISVGVAYHYQVHIKISNTVGILQVKVDDVLVIDQSGLDSQPGAVATIDQFRIGSSSGVTTQDTICVNDITGIAPDNTWPGIVKIRAKLISGAGFYVNNWSRNTGANNYSAVSDIPHDSDTTYLFTTSPAISESFSVSNPVIGFAAYRALRTTAVVKKDTGTVKLQVGIRDLDNNTDYVSSAQDVGVAYSMVSYRQTLDPSTSLSWTQAGLGAVQALIVSST